MSGKARYWELGFLLGLLTLFVFASPQLYAQSQVTATLSGTVLDGSGQAVSGAKVTLSNADKGITRTYTTEGTGLFTFTLLSPASYTLEVAASGFKHYKQEGLTLAAGQTAGEADTKHRSADQSARR